MKRRTFLKGSVAGSVLAVAAGAGLLKPARVLAAEWPQAAYDAEVYSDAVAALYGGAGEATDQITIDAPLDAADGGRVPMKVSTALPNAEEIAVFVVKNPRPFIFRAPIGAGMEPYVSTTVKFAETSEVHAYVKSGGKVFFKSHQTNVAIGGCGG